MTFKTITFSDGTTITLDPQDIVVFVGPNNAGKSAALRELEAFVAQSNPQTVIKAVTQHRTGSAHDLHELLRRRGYSQGSGATENYRGYRFGVNASQLDYFWNGTLGQLSSLFCLRISTDSRISSSDPISAIAILDQTPSHPIHLLFSDILLEQRLSSYFRRAFNKDLILFRLGGNTWPLLVGERLEPTGRENLISPEYYERLRKVTVPLQSQGDGMRSFAGVILHLLTPELPSVLLLDEPEAFLHPPQARLLGEYIAQERPHHSQLFIATHSTDVLQGLLNVASKHMRVIRIQRDGSVNRVRELDKTQATNIANDPLMKYSGVLSGVFHQRVIICESDADCMFYNAILDLEEVRGKQQPDVLFVHSGGKHRMAALAETLRALDINVDVIADIDILNDESVMQRAIKALGGNWDEAKVDAAPLKLAIEGKKPGLNAGQVTSAINGILRGAPPSGEFPKSLRTEIETIFRSASPWDTIKAAGRAAIPPGQPTQHYNSLMKYCGAVGLWIVPVGELEGFYKPAGGHGTKWVQDVLSRNLLKSDELKEARNFVRDIWNRTNASEIASK